MPEPSSDPLLVSRRALLGGGLVALGAVVAGAAWATPAAAAASRTGLSPLVLSSELYASPSPQRFVVALARGGSRGIEYVSGPRAKLRFRSPKGTEWTAFADAPLDRAGLPKGRGVYVTSPVLDTAGVWAVEVKSDGKTVPFAIQVNALPSVPIPGQAAPRAASPTAADALGVNPICTRSPACPLHTASLASVIGAGKPVAAMFATPARCQSQYCGPVLDEMLRLMPSYNGRVTFVHTEIYQSLTGTALVPTLSAWKITTEPWLIGIDGAGVVKARIDGAFGGNEIKQLLDGLIA